MQDVVKLLVEFASFILFPLGIAIIGIRGVMRALSGWRREISDFPFISEFKVPGTRAWGDAVGPAIWALIGLMLLAVGISVFIGEISSVR